MYAGIEFSPLVSYIDFASVNANYIACQLIAILSIRSRRDSTVDDANSEGLREYISDKQISSMH